MIEGRLLNRNTIKMAGIDNKYRKWYLERVLAEENYSKLIDKLDKGLTFILSFKCLKTDKRARQGIFHALL